MDYEQDVEAAAAHPVRRRWTLREITAALSIFLVGFTALALFCVAVLGVNSSLANLLGGGLVLIAAPWQPWLDDLGLWSNGVWFSFPRLWGIFLAVAIYLVLLSIPNGVLSFFRKKPRHARRRVA
jgi:hypothetical protein